MTYNTASEVALGSMNHWKFHKETYAYVSHVSYAMPVMIDQATFEDQDLSALWVQQIHIEGKVASSMALGTAGTLKAEPLEPCDHNNCLSINLRKLDLFKKNNDRFFCTNCFVTRAEHKLFLKC